ncbi:hypothetical protein Tsubulata_035440 [Turnera subulata]|uniref:GINS subunit domain-containing protein n=1 Tax=Turnera subulata TaxID=218843 RepID=A0A9Q0J055_9ROSI|nr:hypothetical protein Tsubulata_035440 [Turnera subulata]
MANYYDIDDILVEEEFVPVLFNKAVNGVRIDESTEKGFVEEGSKSELPFWLARELHLRKAVTISSPSCFNHATRVEIQADAGCVDLRSRCQYFYEFGCKLAPLCDKTIGLLISHAFRIRYKEVLHKAHTTACATASKILTLLTKEETNLYEAAQSSMAAFRKWRMGGPTLKMASVLGRKRKPDEGLLLP